MPLTHDISQPWLGHIAQLRQQIQSDATQELVTRGQIALLEKEIERSQTQRSFNQREINNLVVSLAEESRIDKPVLSEDGTQILGEPKPPPE